jgi:hypothetical protein
MGSEIGEVTTTDGKVWQLGTWLSAPMGWHNSYRVVQEAISEGWEVPEEYRDVWSVFTESLESGHADHDLWWDANGDDDRLSDLATEFLQEKLPEGFELVWDACELTLMTTDEAKEFGHFG